jgi:hypothetical protein
MRRRATSPSVDLDFFKNRLNDPICCKSRFEEEAWWTLETHRRRRRLELFDKIEDQAARIATLKADAQLCANDPIYWMENYAWMYDPFSNDPARREVPVVLWDRQKEFVRWLLKRLRDNKPAVTFKGRSLGVSYLHALLIYNFFRSEPAFTAKIGSRKQELVDDRGLDSLFGKIRFNHDRQPSHLKPEVQDTMLRLAIASTGSEITGEATNPGFGRGGRRRVVFVDEFAQIDPPNLQAKTWVSLASVAPSVWICSTPLGPGNRFADLKRELPSDAIFEMGWRTDPRRDEEWRLEMLKTYSEEEFSQEYDGQIITLSSGRVWNFRRSLNEYHDEDAGFLALGPKARQEKMLLGGWDFGSGPSLLVCLFALFETGSKPRLWIDDELVWQQADWRTAAADALNLQRSRYGGRSVHYGDPAGKQRDSSQLSWETNLRHGGIPLFCLPESFNRSDQIEWAIKRVQASLSEGTLRIHRRCTYLWTCIENWARQVPAGINPDYISKAYIPPQHDIHSHGGMALCYLVSGAFLTLKAAQDGTSREMRDDELETLPKSPAGEMGLTFSRMLERHAGG